MMLVDCSRQNPQMNKICEYAGTNRNDEHHLKEMKHD